MNHFHLPQLCHDIQIQLALGIIIVSFFSDRQGLRNVGDIKRLSEAVWTQLQRELIQRPPRVAVKGDVSILNKLLNKRHQLR